MARRRTQNREKKNERYGEEERKIGRRRRQDRGKKNARWGEEERRIGRRRTQDREKKIAKQEEKNARYGEEERRIGRRRTQDRGFRPKRFFRNTLLLLLFASTNFCDFGIPTILRVLIFAISRSRAKFCDFAQPKLKAQL